MDAFTPVLFGPVKPSLGAFTPLGWFERSLRQTPVPLVRGGLKGSTSELWSDSSLVWTPSAPIEASALSTQQFLLVWPKRTFLSCSEVHKNTEVVKILSKGMSRNRFNKSVAWQQYMKRCDAEKWQLWYKRQMHLVWLPSRQTNQLLWHHRISFSEGTNLVTRSR